MTIEDVFVPAAPARSCRNVTIARRLTMPTTMMPASRVRRPT
jgi:hypothetical protein